jgi:hypothetical protein
MQTGDSASASAFHIFNTISGATGNELFRVQSNGIVGLGTGTPDASYKLTISGASNGVSPGILFNDTAASPENYAFYVNGNKRLTIRDMTTATDRFTVDTNGNIGFGATPDASFRLTVGGNSSAVGPGFLFTDSAASPENYALYINGSKYFAIRDQTAGSNRLTIDTSGKVGIGTSAPSYRLDVDSAGASGAAYLLRASDLTSGGGALNLVGFDGVVGSAVAGDASLTNGVGNIFISPNAPSKDIKLIGGSWTNATSLIVKDGGNIGIGLDLPLAKLQVAGDLRIGSNGANTDLRIFTDTAQPTGSLVSYNQVNTITPVTIPSSGTTSHTALYLKNATATGQGTNQIDLIVDGNIAAKYQDVAEWVPANGDLPAGTLVAIDSGEINHVIPTSHAYDTAVAGVISSQPGIILGEASSSKALVATTGRVRVRATASAGPIHAGDLLVASDKAGVAMVSVPVDLNGIRIHRPGTVIGKALEPLASGEGEILVLLSLQYFRYKRTHEVSP